MNYHTEEELAVIEEFKSNKGELVIFYRKNGSMIKYSSSFSSTFSKLIRKGVIQQVASGDFGWVKYHLKEMNKKSVV